MCSSTDAATSLVQPRAARMPVSVFGSSIEPGGGESARGWVASSCDAEVGDGVGKRMGKSRNNEELAKVDIERVESGGRRSGGDVVCEADAEVSEGEKY